MRWISDVAGMCGRVNRNWIDSFAVSTICLPSPASSCTNNSGVDIRSSNSIPSQWTEWQLVKHIRHVDGTPFIWWIKECSPIVFEQCAIQIQKCDKIDLMAWGWGRGKRALQFETELFYVYLNKSVVPIILSGTNWNYLTKTLMRVQVTSWFDWLTKRTWTVARVLAGATRGIRRLMRYEALALAANGHFPLVKLLHTLAWPPNGHGYHEPATKARMLARAVVAATAALKFKTIWDGASRRTVQYSALQLAKFMDVGLDSPAPPDFHAKKKRFNIGFK